MSVDECQQENETYDNGDQLYSDVDLPADSDFDERAADADADDAASEPEQPEQPAVGKKKKRRVDKMVVRQAVKEHMQGSGAGSPEAELEDGAWC
jgi:hypothetical protein